MLVGKSHGDKQNTAPYPAWSDQCQFSTGASIALHPVTGLSGKRCRLLRAILISASGNA